MGSWPTVNDPDHDRPDVPHAAEEVTITPYRDGPLLVRGPISLRDPDGREIPLRRRTIALCRCGRSGLQPFCDGSHKLTWFRAPSEPGVEVRTDSEGSAPVVDPG